MASDAMDLREEDRLPWLETVEPDEDDGLPLGRVIALVMIGLALLAAIIFGVYQYQHRDSGADGTLITAQGDYKVRPDDPGGLKVKGEGTTAVATSAGKAGDGAIDLKAVPEAPVIGRRAQPQPASTDQGSRSAIAAVPASGGKLAARRPIAAGGASPTGTETGGSLVQLGAYPTEGIANAAWTSFAQRFGYVAALGKTVQPVVAGGKTLYRLRVNAGGANQAAEICGKLKVAGESCFVAS